MGTVSRTCYISVRHNDGRGGPASRRITKEVSSKKEHTCCSFSVSNTYVSSPSLTHLWPHCCSIVKVRTLAQCMSLLQGIMHLSILRPRVSTCACPPISAAWLFASSSAIDHVRCAQISSEVLNITPCCPVYCTHNVWLDDVTVRHKIVHFVHLPLSLPLPTSLFHS
jgi:hypothetical protein